LIYLQNENHQAQVPQILFFDQLPTGNSPPNIPSSIGETILESWAEIHPPQHEVCHILTLEINRSRPFLKEVSLLNPLVTSVAVSDLYSLSSRSSLKIRIGDIENVDFGLDIFAFYQKSFLVSINYHTIGSYSADRSERTFRVSASLWSF
jgi:hypothetical protein